MAFVVILLNESMGAFLEQKRVAMSLSMMV